VAGAKTFADAFRLGAFAHAGRAEQNEPPGFAERRTRWHEAAVGAALEPRGSVMAGHESDRVRLWKKPVKIHAIE
jgi:hypothetical protein